VGGGLTAVPYANRATVSPAAAGWLAHRLPAGGWRTGRLPGGWRTGRLPGCWRTGRLPGAGVPAAAGWPAHRLPPGDRACRSVAGWPGDRRHARDAAVLAVAPVAAPTLLVALLPTGAADHVIDDRCDRFSPWTVGGHGTSDLPAEDRAVRRVAAGVATGAGAWRLHPGPTAQGHPVRHGLVRPAPALVRDRWGGVRRTGPGR